MSHRRNGVPPADPAYMCTQGLARPIETADRKSEAVLKVEAADLAIGDDVKPDRLL